MSKDKQIEEMAEDIYELGELRYGEIWCNDDCVNLAKKLYAVGYRKQSEGEWITSDIPQEKYVCSLCGGACWYYDCQGDVAKSRYCPNCGAKMKGGGEE